jgi:hypothetical protein
MDTPHSATSTYLVTNEQLLEIERLVWGARMTDPGEPKRFNDLIHQIRCQPSGRPERERQTRTQAL